MKSLRSRACLIILAATAMLAVVRTATAGLPLLCHPLDAGNAAVLPWGAAWKSPDPRYDVANLTRDVQRLLAHDMPVLARMENLRRAALYAADHPRIAAALVDALAARAAIAGPADRLPWFDAAYLIETLRQVDMTFEGRLLARADRPASRFAELNALDGYRMLGALQAREGDSAEIEFARGLMMREGREQQHLRRAAQLAMHDPALARNIQAFLH